MKTTIESITPSQAAMWLQKNEGNRTIRSHWVEQLAGYITRGEWMVTHQGIAFDDDGRLLDGQHRLHAILRANMPAKMMVSRGVETKAFHYVDGGKPRFLSDRLHLMSDPGDNLVCSRIVRAYLVYGQGQRFPAVDLADNTFLSMSESFEFVTPYFKNFSRGVSVSAIGAALACYHSAYPIRATEFVAPYFSGEGLERGNPIHTLRESILGGRVKTKCMEMYWKAIQAMRYHADKKPMPKLTEAIEDFRGNKQVAAAFERTRRAKAIGKGLKEKRYGHRGDAA